MNYTCLSCIVNEVIFFYPAKKQTYSNTRHENLDGEQCEILSNRVGRDIMLHEIE
jgi:hypothetical protein